MVAPFFPSCGLPRQTSDGVSYLRGKIGPLGRRAPIVHRQYSCGCAHIALISTSIHAGPSEVRAAVIGAEESGGDSGCVSGTGLWSTVPPTLARTSGRAAGGRATGGVWAASYRLRLDSNPFARATWVVDDYSRMFSRVNGAIHEESVAPICQLKKRLQYQSLVPLFYFWLVGTRRFNSSLQLKTMLIWVGATSPISLDLSIKKRWPSRETS